MKNAIWMNKAAHKYIHGEGYDFFFYNQLRVFLDQEKKTERKRGWFKLSHSLYSLIKNIKSKLKY